MDCQLFAIKRQLAQHCTTGLPDEYSQIEETISPEVLQDIAQWVNSLSK